MLAPQRVVSRPNCECALPSLHAPAAHACRTPCVWCAAHAQVNQELTYAEKLLRYMRMCCCCFMCDSCTGADPEDRRKKEWAKRVEKWVRGRRVGEGERVVEGKVHGGGLRGPGLKGWARSYSNGTWLLPHGPWPAVVMCGKVLRWVCKWVRGRAGRVLGCGRGSREPAETGTGRVTCAHAFGRIKAVRSDVLLGFQLTHSHITSTFSLFPQGQDAGARGAGSEGGQGEGGGQRRGQAADARASGSCGPGAGRAQGPRRAAAGRVP